MAPALLLFPLLLLLLLLRPVTSNDSASMPQASALLLLKHSFTNASALSSWAAATNGSADPCDPNSLWTGVVCRNGIVTGLRLDGMGLGGTIDVDALARLKGLRSVSISHNHLAGPLPPLRHVSALKGIFLSDNRFSGDMADDFFAGLDHLKKLWLSGNNLTGRIPSSISNATKILELHLEDNNFTNEIPDFPYRWLISFNVSHNNLDGVVPTSLSRFSASSFAGNSGLCGEQTGRPCFLSEVTESPVGDPNGKASGTWLVLILMAFVLSVGLVGLWRRKEGFKTLGMVNRAAKDGVVSNRHIYGGGRLTVHRRHEGGHVHAGPPVKAAGGGGGGAWELTMVNGSKGAFGLSDLMKAASVMLGTGDLGSAYKVVMGNGVAVVVKRMRWMNRVGKEMFDVEMRRLGRLRHPNVLTPMAYHYGKDEKLLVFEYAPKGSLLYVLHGDRGPDHVALDWPTRLKIIRGIASGMAYLHAELNSLDIPHGSLKSGNILLSHDLEPLLVDYGYISLLNPSRASQTLFAYKSPESLELGRVSPKSDVYCLGIVIAEVLTGKFPSQYLNNTKGGSDMPSLVGSAIAMGREAQLLDGQITVVNSSVPDMERLLHVGAACMEADPHRRPDMKEAAAWVEEVAVAAEKVGALSAPFGREDPFS